MYYELGTKNILFKYISIHLKNNYKSSLKVSDEYNLDLAKTIYSFLYEYFPTLSFKHNDEFIMCDSVSNYFLRGSEDPDSLDFGCKIYKEIYTDESGKIIYSRDTQTTPVSLSQINKYNIASWPLKDSVIQYIYPGIVVSEISQVDEIASVQNLMTYIGYKPKQLGSIDNDFIKNCYYLQKDEKEKNITIVKSGYFDKTVEFRLRSLSEVTN